MTDAEIKMDYKKIEIQKQKFAKEGIEAPESAYKPLVESSNKETQKAMQKVLD